MIQSELYKYDIFNKIQNVKIKSFTVNNMSYRGEVFFKFKLPTRFTAVPINHKPTTYDVGDRIGQIIILPYPQIEFKEVDELSKTDRGEGGFGSTGK